MKPEPFLIVKTEVVYVDLLEETDFLFAPADACDRLFNQRLHEKPPSTRQE